MNTFVWGDEFRTGIAAVDGQHHALIDLFNRLGDTLTASAGADGMDAHADAQVTQVFAELLAYAEQHFATEEGLMHRACVDARHFTLHRQRHEDFVEQVRAIWSARHTLVQPAEVILSFLTSWLCLHVLGVDQSLARQLALIDLGEAPELAYEAELTRPRDVAAEAMIKALRNSYQTVARLSLELIAANRSLEERVVARTRELREANDALREANRKLEAYAQTDGLLGIANRKYFDTRLLEEWGRACRERHPLGLLMVDVDFFKNFNDHYGHVAGDACLQAVVSAAGACLARSNDLLARYGGEEFVILLPNTTMHGVRKVGERIRLGVAEQRIAHAQSAVAHVTVSVGAAMLLPENGMSAATLVLAADQALYAAKQQGRNCVCLA